ncbi:MAG TPA: transcriptional regulator [Pseudolabrys sp.]
MADNANKTAANSQFRKLRQAEDGKRAMLDYENSATAMRTKTARLRALRLARDAEEAAAAAAAPPPVKKKAVKKAKVAAKVSE